MTSVVITSDKEVMQSGSVCVYACLSVSEI